jgi:hypothetical protein
VSDRVAAQRYQLWRTGIAGVLEDGGDGKHSGGEHGQGDPPVPGGPAADLMLVQAGQALSGLAVRPRRLERFVNYWLYIPVVWPMQARMLAVLKWNIERAAKTRPQTVDS